MAQVQNEGDRTATRDIEHYNPDVVISVGYGVKSQRGVQFRLCATRTLREHLVQGYTLISTFGGKSVDGMNILSVGSLATHVAFGYADC